MNSFWWCSFHDVIGWVARKWHFSMVTFSSGTIMSVLFSLAITLIFKHMLDFTETHFLFSLPDVMRRNPQHRLVTYNAWASLVVEWPHIGEDYFHTQAHKLCFLASGPHHSFDMCVFLFFPSPPPSANFWPYLTNVCSPSLVSLKISCSNHPRHLFPN